MDSTTLSARITHKFKIRIPSTNTAAAPEAGQVPGVVQTVYLEDVERVEYKRIWGAGTISAQCVDKLSIVRLWHLEANSTTGCDLFESHRSNLSPSMTTVCVLLLLLLPLCKMGCWVFDFRFRNTLVCRP